MFLVSRLCAAPNQNYEHTNRFALRLRSRFKREPSRHTRIRLRSVRQTGTIVASDLVSVGKKKQAPAWGGCHGRSRGEERPENMGARNGHCACGDGGVARDLPGADWRADQDRL